MKTILSLAFATATLASNAALADDSKSIAQIASETPALSTLVTALSAANLVNTLSGPGPFTVFAPTNDAFAKLPAGTVDSLLAEPSKQQLTQVLLYHVVSGTSYSDPFRLVGEEFIKTAANLVVKIKQPISSSTAYFINNANFAYTGQGVLSAVVKVSAANGTVYLIDRVLIPEASSIYAR